jgi:hypothetical protein
MSIPAKLASIIGALLFLGIAFVVSAGLTIFVSHFWGSLHLHL